MAAAKDHSSIDTAASQLARDSAQRDLAESVIELAKAMTVTRGGCLDSPREGSTRKAQVAARWAIQIAKVLAAI